MPSETAGSWSKQVEASYFERIGPDALRHAVGKPFTDQEAGRLLIEIGAVIAMLPPPPARIVDWGCGTGWTSGFLGRCGYEVLGLDLSPEAIAAATESSTLPNVRFAVHDFEHELTEGLGQFDACVYFDALHHAEDERAALAAAWSALRSGGVVVLCEPGIGHASSAGSIAAATHFGVRERDMPPRKILDAARLAGFGQSTLYAHPHILYRNLYSSTEPATGMRQKVLATKLGLALRMGRGIFWAKNYWGLVVLTK